MPSVTPRKTWRRGWMGGWMSGWVGRWMFCELAGSEQPGSGRAESPAAPAQTACTAPPHTLKRPTPRAPVARRQRHNVRRLEVLALARLRRLQRARRQRARKQLCRLGDGAHGVGADAPHLRAPARASGRCSQAAGARWAAAGVARRRSPTRNLKTCDAAWVPALASHPPHAANACSSALVPLIHHHFGWQRRKASSTTSQQHLAAA